MPTTYNRALEAGTGRIYIEGRSTATTATVITHYMGYKPSFVTFLNLGTDAVSNTGLYQLDAQAIDDGVAVRLWGPPRSNVEDDGITIGDMNQTVEVTNRPTVEACDNVHGSWKLVIPVAIQTASGFWVAIIER